MVSTLAAHWRHGLALALLILAAALGLGLRWQPPASPTPPATDSAGEVLPDLTIAQGRLEVFGEQGQRLRELRGEQLRYFTAADRSEVTAPSLQFLQRRNDQPPVPWQLTARSAVLTRHGEQIDLAGEVTLWSDATAGGRTEIRSEQLQVDTARQFAETDKAVTIRARRSEVTANGLKADLANERLLLSSGANSSSRVKEIHEVRR